MFAQVLGTPTEDNWPGISMSEDLQNYNFPKYPSDPLVKRAPRLDQDGIDLVTHFLHYEAKRRLGAKEALYHSYFDSLGPQVHTIQDGKCGKIDCHAPSWQH
jgi:hypothetical protein